MQIFNEGIGRQRVSILDDMPDSIECTPSKPAMLHYGEASYRATCLGCIAPKCMFFTEHEIGEGILPNFPGERNRNVCPVEAIKWNYDNDTPIVENEKCLRCGICVKRCPIGALYMGNKVEVNTENIQIQTYHTPSTEILSKHDQQIESLSQITKTGCFFMENENHITKLHSSLSAIKSNLHNIFLRNLLIELNCCCAVRRIGDVYTRVDAIYVSRSSAIGAIEIEYGHDTLDASRAILDDIAMLQTRYELSKECNTPIVVCLQLPNARQGYWQVVKDIFCVEGIKINTISIIALLILLWNNRDFDPNINSYYLDYDDMNLRKKIERHLGREVQIPHKLLGLLEPEK